MGMKDPLPTFTTFIERIRAAHPKFAYIHVVEPRIHGNIEEPPSDQDSTPSNEALREAAGNLPYIAAGGFDRASAATSVEKYGGLVAFGRHFIANVSNLIFISGLILAQIPYYHSPIFPCA
jgi:NADPH2 dehydrogenase